MQRITTRTQIALGSAQRIDATSEDVAFRCSWDIKGLAGYLTQCVALWNSPTVVGESESSTHGSMSWIQQPVESDA